MQETIVRLKVLSPDRTPEQITEALGVPCDSCWRVGDKRVHTIIKETTNGWVLDSKLPSTAILEAHIDALLGVINARVDSVRYLATTSEVVLSCVIYADTAPALYFDNVAIEKLARLGASLDIDLFVHESEA